MPVQIELLSLVRALSYTHTDHLGSSSGQTDTSGNAITDSYLRYYAYGTLRSGDPSQSTTDRTFTGQKQDSTGLMYYNARFYDPALGVFLSPDTLVPDPNVVIDYNRFLYVRGNPLKYNDPSGHIAVCFQGSPATEADQNDKDALYQFCDGLASKGLLGKGDKFGTIFRKFANDPDDKQAALEWIQEVLAFNVDEPINLIGYSWGAAAALELANNMNGKGIAIDAMILIDPSIRFNAQDRVATGDEMPSLAENLARYFDPTVPNNVKRALNLWAKEEDVFYVDGRSFIRGATNVGLDFHHASIMDSNKLRYLWGMSIPSPRELISGAEVNPLTLDLTIIWLKNSP